ncbi:MAG TPA: energy-coupling factor transporter transmembrane component T [Dissulfurispiraceae bacterium]
MPSGIKLLLYSCFAAGLFLVKDLTPHLLIAACVAGSLVFIPFRKTRGGLVPITLFLGFTFMSNLLYQSGRVVYMLGSFALTDEGLRIAGVRTLRVFDMIFAAKVLTSLTPLEDMIASLRKVFQPLERVGLPVHDFFSTMALTLKAFPLLKRRLQEEYRGGGEGKSDMRFKDKMKTAVSFLVPVFVESMRNPESFFEPGGKE